MTTLIGYFAHVSSYFVLDKQFENHGDTEF